MSKISDLNLHGNIKEDSFTEISTTHGDYKPLTNTIVFLFNNTYISFYYKGVVLMPLTAIKFMLVHCGEKKLGFADSLMNRLHENEKKVSD